jgi:hypothetical protein
MTTEDATTTPLAPDPMRTAVCVAFGLYLIVLNILVVYLLIKVWPDQIPPGNAPQQLFLFGGHVQLRLPIETQYLWIVVLSGALGSYIHIATSFADFLGNRQLYGSWIWWYLLRPFIGVALALIVYFAVRGGLIGASTGANALSPFGIAAITGMAGLFSKQATDKLREVFENLLRTERPPERGDKLKS